MAFAKGNQLAKAHKGRMGPRKKMFKEVSDQLISLSPKYNELLENEMNGQELTDAHQDAMNRFERMFEFARPKLARTVIDAKVEQIINIRDEQAERIASRASGKPKDAGKS